MSKRVAPHARDSLWGADSRVGAGAPGQPPIDLTIGRLHRGHRDLFTTPETAIPARLPRERLAAEVEIVHPQAPPHIRMAYIASPDAGVSGLVANTVPPLEKQRVSLRLHLASDRIIV